MASALAEKQAASGNDTERTRRRSARSTRLMAKGAQAKLGKTRMDRLHGLVGRNATRRRFRLAGRGNGRSKCRPSEGIKVSETRGVYISEVEEESPAEKAGMKSGDVVLEFNGEHVEGTVQFRRLIREIPAGHKVQITVWRDGQIADGDCNLGQRGRIDGAWSFGEGCGTNVRRCRRSHRCHRCRNSTSV